MPDPADVLARRRTSHGPGLPLKIFCAVLLVAAVAMAIVSGGRLSSAAGVIVCPLVAAWLWFKNAVRFELDGEGINVRRRGKTEPFAWDDITRVHAVSSRGGNLAAGYRAEVCGRHGALFAYTLWTDGARELTITIRTVLRRNDEDESSSTSG